MYNIILDCSYTLSEYSGFVTSPNYPDPYYGNSDCEWTINMEPGYNITLFIDEFKLQDSSDDRCYDYIQVRHYQYDMTVCYIH